MDIQLLATRFAAFDSCDFDYFEAMVRVNGEIYYASIELDVLEAGIDPTLIVTTDTILCSKTPLEDIDFVNKEDFEVDLGENALYEISGRIVMYYHESERTHDWQMVPGITLPDVGVEAMYRMLTPGQKDTMFRMLWADYVTADVKVMMEDMGKDVNPAVASAVTERYVYQGDYDCNLSYWSQLVNLIEETEQTIGVTKKQKEPFEREYKQAVKEIRKIEVER